MGAPLKLDGRLAALAAMVRGGSRCADVGTDHGYLIAWLAASGKIPSGFACDINRKPLEKAAFTLSANGVADRVRTVLCDGLSGVPAGEVDDIVIAGMGGDLIWDILDAAPWTRDGRLRLLLQPMTKAERLRRKLYANGFEIERERAVLSGGFPYAVLQAAYTGRAREVPPAFAWCGLLLDEPGEAAALYRAKVARLLREKADGLALASSGRERLAEYEAVLKLLEGRCAQ